MSQIKKLLAAAVAGIALAGSAAAGSVGFKFSVVTTTAARNALGLATSAAGNSGPNLTSDAATANTPYVLIESIGTSAATLDGFSFTIGASRFFDFVIRESGYNNLTWAQVSPGSPDNNDNGVAGQAPISPTMSYTFGGFNAGERFSAQTDVDAGSLNLTQLLAAISGKTVMANFSNGRSLSASFASAPVETAPGVYSVQASVVPLPTAGWAGLALMGTCGVMQYRRKLALQA